ncbi:hypothetical protein Avbf_07418 [Armadillidium vulgare]|nr:hypothetical protein Avbf_07418 [Armadillidium vulgare]
MVTNAPAKRSPRSLLNSPYKTGVKQIARKVYASELPRPCKANGFPSDTSKSPIRYNPLISPREKMSQIPSQKTRSIPKQRIVKKIDSLPQTHIPPTRRHNTPICKSDISSMSNVGSKASKTERSNPISFRGDSQGLRKPWR